MLICVQVVKLGASLTPELHKKTKPIEENWSAKRTFVSNGINDSRHEDILSVLSTALCADMVREMSSVDSVE